MRQLQMALLGAIALMVAFDMRPALLVLGVTLIIVAVIDAIGAWGDRLEPNEFPLDGYVGPREPVDIYEYPHERPMTEAELRQAHDNALRMQNRATAYGKNYGNDWNNLR